MLLYIGKACVKGDIIVYSKISHNSGENTAILLAEKPFA
jgi:hypothetical protein